MNRVAFQGELGAFSELAAREHFGEARLIPCREFQIAAERLLNGEVDYAVLPIENTLAGVVEGTRDILRDERFTRIAELWLPIHHYILGVPGGTLEGVQSALSHPVALAQCTTFFRRHPAIKPVVWYDTAGAAKYVARAGDATRAAIAGRAAADRYHLIILADNIEDRTDNRTRFAVLAPR